MLRKYSQKLEENNLSTKDGQMYEHVNNNVNQAIFESKAYCSMCQTKFSRNSVKNRHDRIFHGRYLEIFKCNHCESESLEPGNIIKHYSTAHPGVEIPRKGLIKSRKIENTTESMYRNHIKFFRIRIDLFCFLRYGKTFSFQFKRPKC